MEQLDAFDDELQATHKQLLEELHYDPETGEFKWLKSGHGRPNGKAGHLDSRRGYNKIRFKGKLYRGARLAYFYMTGGWPLHQMDHVNGNPSDDSWDNLRAVTAQENHKNRKMPNTNRSGVQGVSWLKINKKWKAEIKPSAQEGNKHLGCFDFFSDAVEARKAAEVKYGFHPNHGRET
jgi:hypothetical protein